MLGCHWRKASHNASNARDVAASKIGRNSSDCNCRNRVKLTEEGDWIRRYGRMAHYSFHVIYTRTERTRTRTITVYDHHQKTIQILNTFGVSHFEK